MLFLKKEAKRHARRRSDKSNIMKKRFNETMRNVPLCACITSASVCSNLCLCYHFNGYYKNISDNWKMKIKTRSEVLFRTIFRVAPAPACFEVNEPSLLRNVSIFILNLIIEITYDCSFYVLHRSTCYLWS